MSDVLISIACLLVVCVSCGAGLLSKHYRDNWLQFAGLWGIGGWSAGRAWQLSLRWFEWMTEPVMPMPDMSAQQLIGHIGLALFAVGTAWKVWHHRAAIAKDGEFQRGELQ